MEHEAADVVIIGAGVAGCCVARELMRFDLDVVVLEAGGDIACGATRANSAIVHAGYDPAPGTLKARFNVEGARLMPLWARELGFDYEQCGALVLAFSDDDREKLHALADRAAANGAEPVRIIDGSEARSIEPALPDTVVAALDVPASGICDPYGLSLAALENAIANGARLYLQERVIGIQRIEDRSGASARFLVTAQDGREFAARAVINAAGVHADDVNALAGASPLKIVPRRGSYLLYDSSASGAVSRTLFQTPTERGKGVLVAKTVHGNMFVGPDSREIRDKDDATCDRSELEDVLAGARRVWPEASAKGAITCFAGVRATGAEGDFVVGEDAHVPGWFTIACFDSPGLSSAPAVAVEVAGRVRERLGAGRNRSFDPVRPAPRRFSKMTEEERAAAIAEDPAWGHVVCRCEQVTEAELREAMEGPVPVLNLDALKWRTRAMMGRCHGGFCTPDAIGLLARHLDRLPEHLDKKRVASPVVASSRAGYLALAPEDAKGATACHERYDVVVVGAGAAGMAAASSARREGAERVLLLDRQPYMGGVLRQCIHDGFGLHRYGEELTGPEFSDREESELTGVEVLCGTTVLEIGDMDGCGYRRISAVNGSGTMDIAARAVVVAAGSRERGVGSLALSGSRPAGVFSAGTAQTLINLHGCIPGSRAVVLGSGDIGLIMARRMLLSGMEVEGVYEIMPYPSGLRRNIVQCLDDFGVSLHLSQTVVRLEGTGRLEAVWVAQVDPETRSPIPGTERRVACDTLVASIGLVPEFELLRAAGASFDAVTGGAVVDTDYMTRAQGVFACGNGLHVHDLADEAALEGEEAGRSAARYAREGASEARQIPLLPGEGVRYVVPQLLNSEADAAVLKFRVARPLRSSRLIVEAVRPDGSARTLARRALQAAVPAEMLSISLPGFAGGDGADADSIIVRIEERERT